MSNSSNIKVLLINSPLFYYFNRHTSAVHVLPVSVYLEKAEWYIKNVDRSFCLKEIWINVKR